MIYERQSYVSSNMCDSKLKLSILAADGIVENAVTELMGDLCIDGIVAMENMTPCGSLLRTTFSL